MSHKCQEARREYLRRWKAAMQKARVMAAADELADRL